MLDDTENCTMSVSTNKTASPKYLKNTPKGWSVPSAPGGWTPATRKEEKGDPKFEDVDNPGQWSEFTFRPKFEGKCGSGAYGHHATPSGAKVVPLDLMTGKRTVNEFYFSTIFGSLRRQTPTLAANIAIQRTSSLTRGHHSWLDRCRRRWA